MNYDAKKMDNVDDSIRLSIKNSVEGRRARAAQRRPQREKRPKAMSPYELFKLECIERENESGGTWCCEL